MKSQENNSFTLANPDKAFALVLIKATRKPVILEENLSYADGLNQGDDWAKKVSKLYAHSLASSGISIRLIKQTEVEKAMQVEIGGLTFHGVKEEFSWGGY